MYLRISYTEHAEMSCGAVLTHMICLSVAMCTVKEGDQADIHEAKQPT